MSNPISGINIRHDRFYHWLKTMELKAPFNCRREGFTSRYKVICTKYKM